MSDDDVPEIEDHAVASLPDVLSDETFTEIAAVAASKLATAPGWTTLNIQQDLNKLGASPPLVEDGKAGPLTAAALKAFQSAHSIKETTLGPATEAAIVSALGGMAQVYVPAGPVLAPAAPAAVATPFVIPPPGVVSVASVASASKLSTKALIIGGGLAAAAAAALAFTSK